MDELRERGPGVKQVPSMETLAGRSSDIPDDRPSQFQNSIRSLSRSQTESNPRRRASWWI